MADADSTGAHRIRTAQETLRNRHTVTARRDSGAHCLRRRMRLMLRVGM